MRASQTGQPASVVGNDPRRAGRASRLRAARRSRRARGPCGHAGGCRSGRARISRQSAVPHSARRRRGHRPWCWRADDAAACPVACLVSANPYLSYARIAADLHPPAPLRPGHRAGRPSSAPAAGCRRVAQIEPGAVIGAGAMLGERVYIGPNAVIGAGCRDRRRHPRHGRGQRSTTGVRIGAALPGALRCRHRRRRLRHRPGASRRLDQGAAARLRRALATTSRSAPTPPSIAAPSRTP